MTTKSFMIALEDISLDLRLSMRQEVERIILEAALKRSIRADDRDLIIRDTLPLTDLGLAATDDWLIPGPGVAGTELQYFSAALANDRVVAFYGIGAESAPGNVSRVRFTLGAASVTTRGYYQLEQLYSRLEPIGYFSEPNLWLNNETVRVMVMPRLAFAANVERVHLLGRTIEPIGTIVSSPSA